MAEPETTLATSTSGVLEAEPETTLATTTFGVLEAEPETTLATTTFGVLEAEPDLDGFFIGGMVCVALGVVFTTIAVVYLVVWCCRNRNEKTQEKRRRRHLEHMRYLEEYSIKAGDSPNEAIAHNNNPPQPGADAVFKWESSDLVNMGYVSEDTLERLSQTVEGPKLEAHMNGSSSAYAHHRASSNTGSVASRPNSVASNVGVAKAPSDGNVSATVNPKRTSDESNMSRKPRSDRLADVPV